MGTFLVNREELKNRIIQAYYNANIDSDFVDLQSPAIEQEEPFVSNFKKIIENYRNSGYGSQHKENAEDDLLDVEDIEEIDEEDTLDIDILNDIESVVIRTLQYLNLEFYSNEKIKEFIINITMDNLKNKSMSWNTKDRISNVIKNLVDHEFSELDNKRRFRKETLISTSMEYFDNILNDMIENHRTNSTGKLNDFQKKILKKFIYDSINDKYIDDFKRKNKLNYEELKFVDNLVKTMIVKKISSYSGAL